MRVGILTFHTADNYGAVLQAWALAQTLRNLKHDPFVIDYRPATATKMYRRFGVRSGTVIATIAKRWAFRQFRQHQLPLSKRCYRNYDDLSRFPFSLDRIIVGSDQVWNVSSYRGYDPAFFLKFGVQWGVRCASYAASVGSAPGFGRYADEIRSSLEQFDHVSVRDCHSADVIGSLLGTKPPSVLDPVFLAEFDDVEAVQSHFPKQAIVAYSLEKSDQFTQILQRAGERLGMPVCSLGFKTRGADIQLPGIGPAEWAYCMRKATFIVTSSFHGLAFAIKYGISFAVFPRAGMVQQRLDDLLRLVGLEDRIVRSPEELDAVLGKEVLLEATPRLQVAKVRSLEFLRSVLE